MPCRFGWHPSFPIYCLIDNILILLYLSAVVCNAKGAKLGGDLISQALCNGGPAPLLTGSSSDRPWCSSLCAARVAALVDRQTPPPYLTRSTGGQLSCRNSRARIVKA